MTTILLLSSILYFLCLDFSLSITALLRPKDEECFFDHSVAGEEIHGSYSVTHGDTPIDVHIYSPDDNIVLELTNSLEDGFTFMALSEGLYSICFESNSDSDLQTVEFELHIGDEVAVKNVMKEGHLTPIAESVSELRKGVSELNEQTRYHRNRLLRHRKTTQSTGTRITWWAVVQAIILVTLSLTQTWYVKGLFDQKRKV